MSTVALARPAARASTGAFVAMLMMAATLAGLPARATVAAVHTVSRQAGHLRAEFGGGTVTVGDDSFSLGLQLTGVERAGATVSLHAPGRHVTGGRISYDHGAGVTSWYRTTAAGVEQGFDLARRPAGAGPLDVRVGLAGDVLPVPDAGGIKFMDLKGNPVATYDDLHAVDADGRALPTTASIDGHAIVLRVDDACARYPITIDPLVATPELTLSPLMYNKVCDIAMSGTTAAVGYGCTFDGRVGIFERSGNTWTARQTIDTPPTTEPTFGSSVVLSSNYLVVGAPRENGFAGAVYVYARQPNGWQLAQRITPAAPASQFGTAVAIEGNTLVVGAQAYFAQGVGAAYTFDLRGGSWTDEQKLVATDATPRAGFGTAVAIAGGTVAIGAQNFAPLTNTPSGTETPGAVYLYQRDEFDQFFQTQKLTSPQPAPADGFGAKVVMRNGTLVVGEPSLGRGGAAHFYRKIGSAWAPEYNYFTGSVNDAMGAGLAVSSGGDTVVVGVPRQNRADILVRTNGLWHTQANLALPATALDTSVQSNFGVPGAVDGDGALIGVGGHIPELAYGYARTGDTWSAPATLYKPTLAHGAGAVVAVSANYAVLSVPAPAESTFSFDVPPESSVWVYEHHEYGYWNLVQAPTQRQSGDRSGTGIGFGAAVALTDNDLIIGAPAADSGPNAVDTGAVFVYHRSSASGAYLDPRGRLDALNVPLSAGDAFGSSIALDGDRLIVGAPLSNAEGTDSGAAYTFVRTSQAPGWRLAGPLLPAGGSAGDRYGSSVAISGDTAVIGAPADDTAGGVDAGSAYVWQGSSAFTQRAQLTALDGTAAADFGRAVAIAGDNVVVGAPGAANHAGTAYVFTRQSAIGWLQTSKLTAATSAGGDQFGQAVAISPDGIAVGAPGDDTAKGVDAGSVSLFAYDFGLWSASTLVEDSLAGARGGASVAFGGGRLIVGAPNDPFFNAGTGAARLYTTTRTHLVPATVKTITGTIKGLLQPVLAIVKGLLGGGQPSPPPAQ